MSLVLALTYPASSQTISALTVPLLLPTSVAFDVQGNVYLAEMNHHVIRRLDAGGTLNLVAGDGTQGFSGDHGPAIAAQLDSPAGVVLDPAKNLYIADTHNQRIRRVDAATGLITTIAGGGRRGFSGDGGPAVQASLDLPTALALDTRGNLYIADTENHRIRRVDATSGVIVTVAGNGLQQFSGDGGLATAASIDSPGGLAVDTAGNLYLADTHNHRVRMVNAATGLISTLAGTGSAGFTGGSASAATGAALAFPRGLSVDSVGNIDVADSNNQRIRRITPQGTIMTIAGDGTQAASGDGGTAAAASLDTPRGTTLSPAGLVTIADTGNGRIRQIAVDTTIATVVGLSVLTPGTLTIATPSMLDYGSGVMAATLTTSGPATSTPATGQITFLDSTVSGVKPLGSATLAGNSARLGVGTLAVGTHSIVCLYSGDLTHAAAQSTTTLLTIAAAPLTASASSVSILYGQPIPPLTGTLGGILAQDQGQVALVLSTGAAALSPVGTYPIATGLSGPAAGNYLLGALLSGILGGPTLTINKAPSVAILSAVSSSMVSGQAVTLAMHVASTTSGTPTGSVTLLDGATPLADLSLSPAANVSYSTKALGDGSHVLSGVYGGDVNFLASTAAAQTLVVAPGIPGDFALAATGTTSQTVVAGSVATFSFTVQMEGAGSASPITLAASTLPIGMSASFSPTYLPPGGAITAFTLVIQTPKARAATAGHAIAEGSSRPFVAVGLLLLPLLSLTHRRRQALAGLLCAACLVLLAGCGARIAASTANSAAAGASYPILVSATATSPAGTVLLHTVTVQLTVQ